LILAIALVFTLVEVPFQGQMDEVARTAEGIGLDWTVSLLESGTPL
jgi:hypothetical protein